MVTVTVCLDGSAPGYHLHRGFGSGANRWLVNLEVSNTLAYIFIQVTDKFMPMRFIVLDNANSQCTIWA
jgi:hypothetical protein